MADSALKRAQEAFALEDVYIAQTSAFATDVDPTVPVEHLNVQFRINAGGRHGENAEQYYVSAGNTRTNHLRYFIDTGLRILKPGIEPPAEGVSREHLAAEITATFVVKYQVKGDDAPPQELVEAFADNAVHHMWPYWREFIHSTTARLRIPTVVLPMRTAKLRAAEDNARIASADAHNE